MMMLFTSLGSCQNPTSKEVKGDEKNSSAMRALMSQADIPNAEETGFPFYPGSTPTITGTMNDSVSFINLLTTDDINRVKDFYKENLPGYNWHNLYSFFSTESNPMETMQKMRPMVSLMEADSESSDMALIDEGNRKNIRTRIQIVYSKP